MRLGSFSVWRPSNLQVQGGGQAASDSGVAGSKPGTFFWEPAYQQRAGPYPLPLSATGLRVDREGGPITENPTKTPKPLSSLLWKGNTLRFGAGSSSKKHPAASCNIFLPI